MIINYNANFRASDMDEAIRTATKRWREITGRPEEKLPWGATLTIEDSWDDIKEGKHVELRISADYAADAS